MKAELGAVAVLSDGVTEPRAWHDWLGWPVCGDELAAVCAIVMDVDSAGVDSTNNGVVSPAVADGANTGVASVTNTTIDTTCFIGSPRLQFPLL